MLRSATVVPCDLYLQPATAFETMAQLGEINCVEFVDTHPEGDSTMKSYTSEISRCNELEKKLGFFEYEMLKEGNKVSITYPETNPKPIHPSEMVMFENMIEKWETDILENSETLSDLRQDLVELKEMGLILKDIGPMLDDAKTDMDNILTKFQEECGDALFHGTLYIMTGVVDKAKSFQCQVMLWRISLGNIHYRQAANDLVVENPVTGTAVRKVAFMAVCQGEALRCRMEKVCAAFKATIHPCPRCPEERKNLIYRIENRITDLEIVLSKTKYYRCMALRSIGKQWRVWLIQVRKSKVIYHNMNLMTLDLPKNCLIGRCWVAERDVDKVQRSMDTCTELMGVRAPSVISKVRNVETFPPTLHHTNKLSRAPQVLINAYGEARYKEINPGLFTVVGLPFLFGVMFSDMGHGIIITVIALWMIFREEELKKRKNNEVWDIIFGGRYILLLMGLWSIYAGFIFNQLFTKSVNFSRTNSMYKNIHGEGILVQSTGTLSVGANGRQNRPYVYGNDPMWQMSKNKLAMKNSQMMKLSIIIGTIHMMFGLLISACNHRYFKNSYAICLQFLPQFLFMGCIFGWTVFLIYYKWWYYYEGHSNPRYSADCAPPILPLFLARFIMPVPLETYTKCHIYFLDDQQLIEAILNLIIILSVLVLLFGTPVYIHIFNLRTKSKLRKEMRNFRSRHMKGCKLACKNPCGDLCEDACRKQEEKWKAVIERHSTPFSLLLTNQFIYTIDFVLGTVSHVASYLRLWALGVGHYLIADMLWIMTLTKCLRIFDKTGKWILIVGFAFFAILTFIVLVVMEGLCCFLHALRLHWVEFMSKFYVDEGHAFKPFGFKDISSEMHTKSTTTKYSKISRQRQKGFKCLTTTRV